MSSARSVLQVASNSSSLSNFSHIISAIIIGQSSCSSSPVRIGTLSRASYNCSFVCICTLGCLTWTNTLGRTFQRAPCPIRYYRTFILLEYSANICDFIASSVNAVGSRPTSSYIATTSTSATPSYSIVAEDTTTSLATSSTTKHNPPYLMYGHLNVWKLYVCRQRRGMVTK